MYTESEDASSEAGATEEIDRSEVFKRSLPGGTLQCYLVIYAKDSPPSAIIQITKTDRNTDRIKTFEVRLTLSGRTVGVGGFKELKKVWDTWVDFLENQTGDAFFIVKADLQHIAQLETYKEAVDYLAAAQLRVASTMSA